MEIIFEDKNLEELVKTGKNHKYKKYSRDARFMEYLQRAFYYMKNVEKASDLTFHSFLHYESLANRKDESSIRINNSYVERIVFFEVQGGIIIKDVKLDTQHYGRKK